MLITKMIIRITKGRADIDSIQVVECGFSKVDEYGKQYYVDGFFGMSQKYGNWDDAMDDTARRCGFTFVHDNDDDADALAWNEACDAMAKAEANYYDDLGWEETLRQEQEEYRRGIY